MRYSDHKCRVPLIFDKIPAPRFFILVKKNLLVSTVGGSWGSLEHLPRFRSNKISGDGRKINTIC